MVTRQRLTRHYAINSISRTFPICITEDLSNVRNTLEADGKPSYFTNSVIVDCVANIIKRCLFIHTFIILEHNINVRQGEGGNRKIAGVYCWNTRVHLLFSTN